MSAESDYKCSKCGYEWSAIPPSECQKCSTHSSSSAGSDATVLVFLKGKSGQTLQGRFAVSMLPKIVEFFCQCEQEATRSRAGL